jgi:hypothetical protein
MKPFVLVVTFGVRDLICVVINSNLTYVCVFVVGLCRAPIARNYESEQAKSRLGREDGSFHPLLPHRKAAPAVVVKEVKPTAMGVMAGKRSSMSSNSSSASMDPLSAMSSDPLSDPLSSPMSNPLMDPLSFGSSSSGMDDPLSSRSNDIVNLPRAVDSASISKSKDKEDASSGGAGSRNPWQIKKAQILSEFAITGSITMNSSAVKEFQGSGVEDGSATRYLDKYTQRLANLEKRYVSEEKVSMTGKEYEAHVNKLSSDLSRAWAKDERVGSLKIAIQMAKLLADTNMPQFYPAMFVMITTELDRFGSMVYTRLKTKAEEGLNENNPNAKKRLTLSENFVCADVPTAAKETCRNWFYKTACIRELLPRIYIEVALLKCYRFLTDADFPQILSRVGSIIRGLGDPLVSLYARAYLVVIGNDVAPQSTGFALSMMQDVLYSFKMLKEPHHASELTRFKLSSADYIRLLAPGMEWVLHCVGKSASKEVFQGLLQQFRDSCNDTMVLKHIIDSFDPSYHTHAALGMASLIKSSDQSSVTHIEAFASLGKAIAAVPPPEEQRLPLLNEVWKVVSKCEDLLVYVQCASAWLDAAMKHYSERETLILLADLGTKLAAYAGVELSEPVQKYLESIVTSLLSNTPSGSSILTSDNLLKILDIFTGHRKVELCKEIIQSFRTHKSTNDAILINTMFYIARTIHDSVDCLSADSEHRYVGNLLCGFIDKIDFDRDLEQQLNVYVECRSIFCNSDMVKDKLVLCVGGLAVKAYKYVKGKHSKKTAAFAKACLAFCHITIPSIADVFRKLELLLYCAQVALLNQCLPQTDTFLKAAISLIPEAPSHVEDLETNKRVHAEEKLLCYLRSLLGFLVVAPGHPEHGPFYIVQGLLNAVPRYQWQPQTGLQTKVFIDILGLLATFAQKKFPYKISQVESNDSLYGGAIDYMQDLHENITTCIAEIVKQLTALGERTDVVSKLNQVCPDLCK